MVRLLHFADLHLDRSFAGVSMASGEASRRREELRAALRRIIQLALEREVDALTVGGDLYERDRVTGDTAQFLIQQFTRFEKPVLIAPGNHDPYVPDSLYRRLPWPSNVHIFKSGSWQPFALGEVTVWGIGHNAPDVRDNYLDNLRLNPGGMDIALLHGSDLSKVPEQKVTHCPFQAEDVDRCGAAFVLLGHYHGMRLSERYGYPGSPEPLGFDEEGAHYVLELTVDRSGAQAETLVINEVSYHTERIDVSAMRSSDQVREAIAGLAEGDAARKQVIRAVLGGEADPELEIDVDAILSGTAERFRYLEINDETEPAFDVAQISEEHTTRGAFVRLMQERMAAASEGEQAILRNALLYGLQAFEGREVRPR